MMSANRIKDRLPFCLREQFLSIAELALLSALQQMADGHYVICPKVALNDIFYVQRPNENVHFYNKIFRKHVDFLLCEPEGMKPAFGVELVKRTAKDDTRNTNNYMAELFMGAGLPLVHVPPSEQYELADLIPLFQLAVVLNLIKSYHGYIRNSLEKSYYPGCTFASKNSKSWSIFADPQIYGPIS